MNPWLITWDDDKEFILYPIVAILHNTTKPDTIYTIIRHAYTTHLTISNEHFKPSEQVMYAQRKYKCDIEQDSFCRLFTNTSPRIWARHVYNLRVIEKNGHEVLIWEEGIYPKITQATPNSEIMKNFNYKKRRPRRRMLVSLDTGTREYTYGLEITDPD